MHLRFKYVLLLFFALALIIRFHNLGRASLWLDEILQIQCTSRPISSIWANHPANKPPTDYYIQWFFVRGNPDEVRIRLHACLLGSAVVVAMGIWGGAMGGHALALIAMALSLGLPVLVRFSQEGRGYSLMLLAECLFFAAFWKLARSENRWKPTRWIFLIVSLALCIWSHYSAILACFWAAVYAGGWWIVGRIPKRPTARQSDPATAGAVQGAAKPAYSNFSPAIPIIGVLLTLLTAIPAYFFMKADAATGYFAPWDVIDVPKRAMLYLDIFALGYEWTQYVCGASWVLLALGAIGWIGWQRKPYRAAANFCLVLIAGCFAGSFFLFWKMNHWMEMRYVLTALPPVLMLAAMGIESIGRFAAAMAGFQKSRPSYISIARSAAITIPTGLLAMFLCAYTWTHPIKRLEWREIAQYVGSHAESDSVIITASSQEKIPLQYYFNRLGVRARIETSRYKMDKIRNLYYGYGDVWLIFARDGMPPDFRKAIQAVPETKRTFWRMDVRRKPTGIMASTK